MKEFEIWSEGYAVTGQSSGAILHCKSQGVDFTDAIKNANHNQKLGAQYKELYDSWYIWGCKLFDNETDARKSFG